MCHKINFERGSTGWISEYFLSLTGCHIKLKKPILPYYLHWIVRRGDARRLYDINTWLAKAWTAIDAIHQHLRFIRFIHWKTRISIHPSNSWRCTCKKPRGNNIICRLCHGLWLHRQRKDGAILLAYGLL